MTCIFVALEEDNTRPTALNMITIFGALKTTAEGIKVSFKHLYTYI